MNVELGTSLTHSTKRMSVIHVHVAEAAQLVVLYVSVSAQPARMDHGFYYKTVQTLRALEPCPIHGHACINRATPGALSLHSVVDGVQEHGACLLDLAELQIHRGQRCLRHAYNTHTHTNTHLCTTFAAEQMHSEIVPAKSAVPH